MAIKNEMSGGDNILLLDRIRKTAKASLKEKRYAHSERVAETAWLMCKIYNEDPDKGFLAGLAHDLCKDMSEEEMLKIASTDGMPILPEELNKLSLLHGRAAAVKLRNEFGVTDEDVLQAVALHTLGGKNMCNLAKIVYAADKIEPGRPQSTDEYRDNLFRKTLNDMCKTVLEENFEYLRSRSKTVATISLEFYESLK